MLDVDALVDTALDRLGLQRREPVPRPMPQPMPNMLLVIRDDTSTIVTRGWAPGDAAQCRLCEPGTCGAAEVPGSGGARVCTIRFYERLDIVRCPLATTLRDRGRKF